MRPILLGMNNPLSQDPAHALFPYPPGCTGHRILEMLRERQPAVTRAEYLAAFDRRNLLPGATWSATEARVAAHDFVQSVRLTDSVIVVLGEEPRRALDLPKLLLHPAKIHGCTWRQLPHPSGRNLWYNDEKNRTTAALLLEELYVLSRQES